MRVLVTGAAGFIGYFVSQKLLARGDEVIGLDNLNNYYDVNLKLARLELLKKEPGFSFHKLELADRASIDSLFAEQKFDRVVHLAVQAGVRYSIENPHSYIDSNVTGTLHIMEGCRHHGVEHLVYASTSSVYGANTHMPFSVHDSVNHPLSLYAATKKANEMMAHTYSALFGLPTTGLRFFTVYGPFGRPDMALFQFTKSLIAGEPIDVFNFGNHRRDFTFVQDIAEGVVRAMDHVAESNADWDPEQPDPGTSNAPFRLYNIGNSKPVELRRYIEVLEECLGRKAELNLLPMQPGDVPDTWADVQDLADAVGYRPATSVEDGVRQFVDWYVEFYGVDLS
jgi:UDP-glucuronate 4-epimerase